MEGLSVVVLEVELDLKQNKSMFCPSEVGVFELLLRS